MSDQSNNPTQADAPANPIESMRYLLDRFDENLEALLDTFRFHPSMEPFRQQHPRICGLRRQTEYMRNEMPKLETAYNDLHSMPLHLPAVDGIIDLGNGDYCAVETMHKMVQQTIDNNTEETPHP